MGANLPFADESCGHAPLDQQAVEQVNRCFGCGINDYFPQRRYMERVTIKGGAVDGVERADPETVRKAIRRTTGKPPSMHGKPQAPITPETAKV